MVSIVCSSINPDKKYEKEILKKIGLKDVEFLHYENKGEYSLTELYEKGLAESQNDIVLFIHDDLIMNTNNWGRNLVSHFNETDYGILGIAGTTNLTETGTWWTNQNEMVGIVNHKHKGKTFPSEYSANLNKEIIKTVLVDGLFFAVSKSRLKYDFDTTIKGFHFYDVDFSFGNHLNGCNVGVIFDIRVTHLSIGQTNEKWEENKKIFIDKWASNLPTSIVGEIFYDKPIINIKKEPKLSIIIPHIHNNEMLFKCLESLNKTNYSNYEIIVADTGSTDEELEVLGTYINEHDKISLVKYDYYNFGKINNEVVRNHVDNDAEVVLFCNNDIEMMNDSISIMIKYYINNKKVVGTIGPRLYFENNRIQHAGIVAYYKVKDKQFGVSHVGLNSYYKYNTNPVEVFGNTGAFLMMNKTLFNQIGGFNENYTECLEDVELNTRCLLLNKKNYNISEAVSLHKESSTRNKDANKIARFQDDYKTRLAPFINENLNEKIKKYIMIIN